MPDNIDVIQEFVDMKNSWQWRFYFWYSVHYMFGFTTIILSSLLAAKPDRLKISADNYSLLSWILALTTSLFVFLTPGEKGDRFNKAWSLLNSKLIEYKITGKMDVEGMTNALLNGEEIIHEVATRTPSSGSN